MALHTKLYFGRAFLLLGESMPAGKLNLDVEQGATYRKVLIWKGSDKVPIDLTGYTASMRILGGALPLDLTTANSRITLETGGKITLILSAADTQAMVFTAGTYDLKLIIGTEEIRLVEGHVYVCPAVTPRAT